MTTPTTDALTPERVEAAILAMDRLNSYVRSEAHNRHYLAQSLKPVVYALKRRLLAAFPDPHWHKEEFGKRRFYDFSASHRFMIVIAECRACSGTGLWSSWQDVKRTEPCNRCEKGRTLLYFVESTLYGPYHLLPAVKELAIWHSPVEQFPLARPTNLPYQRTDWKPGLAGQDCTVAAVAEALNTVEPLVAMLSAPRWSLPLVPAYRLYIGETMPGCRVCGEGDRENLTRQREVSGPVEWTVYLCDRCKGCRGADTSQYVPVELLRGHSSSGIRAWIRRKERAGAILPKMLAEALDKLESDDYSEGKDGTP